MKSVTTKICKTLLLALIAALASSNAWASVTINVKAPSAPHVYVWNSSQTPLNGAWPGDVVTDTKVVNGETYYTKTFNENTVSVIFAKDNNTQTGDFSGLTGEVFFHYDGETLAYGVLPDNVIYEPTGKFLYFINSKNWSTVNCHVYNGNSTNTEAMTYIGDDKAGQKVYKWGPKSNLGFEPADVIFNNGSWADQGGVQTPSQSYTNGGYYVYSETNNGSNKRLDLVATIDASRITNTATYFSDAHFREAITKRLGVTEGSAFTPADYTILDLSYDSEAMTGEISNLSGLEHFTNLEELYAGDNDIKFVDLENATKLRILDMHHNENLLGFGTGNPSSTNHIVRLPSGCLQYINMSNTRLRNYAETAFANKVAGTLETFIARDVYYTSDVAKFAFNSVPSVTTLTKLKYLDVSGCDGTPVTIIANLANMKSTLEYLDISNQHMTTNGLDPALDGFTALQTFKFNNQSTWSKSLSINNCPSLTYVDVSGNTAMTGLTINNCGLTTLNFPEAATLSTLTHLATLNVSNNPFTVLNIPQTPNSLLTVTANDCSTMTGILAEHNKSKLQYVTAHNCPALTDITINGADIYFNKQLNAFDATNKSTLETLDLSNDAMTTNYALDGFTALQTVDFDNNYMDGNNNDLHSFTAINCPALTSVNLDGNANMETITLKSNGFDNRSYPVVTVDAEASNVTLDFSDNNFTAVPNIQASQINVLKLNSNQLTDINIPDGCNVNYLYAQENNFGSGDYTLPQTSLVGLDLGNNGFTKFKAENNTSLKSLALSGNDALTEIELHGNTQLTQTSPDGVIENDNGLYIKNLSSLQTLNIENSNFNKLGQESSLEGCDGLTKLQARKNKFTTFTNSVYPLDVSTSGNYRYAETSESSLEHLVNLEYLDLAYNELCDSVHLYRNVNLKHLDVSHNNEIHGVIDGTITPSDVAAQNAMRTKKAKRLVKHGMKYGDKGELTDELYAQACEVQNPRQVPFDIRYEDLNDTTGLYHLDLQKNVNLEWIDISYTNIHNTGAGPGVMNPGWMSADWVGDSEEALAATIKSNTSTHRSHSAFHTFVYFAPCSKLKTIHMDHCNMQSLGISYFPELDTLTASYMYGDCYFMRDAKPNDLRYGMANTGPGRVRKYLSPKANSQGIEDAVNVVGPDGTENTYYDNNIKYYDISYSGFNELRFNYGINLEYIDVSGNPLNYNVSWHDATLSYNNSLDVTYCPNIKTVLANDCSALPTVRAYNRDQLETLDLTNDPSLKTVYAQDDAMLQSITGLSTLTGLETLFAYNNPQFGGIDVSNNTALKNLWVSNIGANSLDVSHNTGLLKLRAYDNSLSTLNVSANTALTWLDVARNKIPSLDLSANAALQYFNCSNSEEALDDQSLVANSHNGGEADDVKPVTSSHSASDTGNSLSDLVFNASAPIVDVRANSNDLHRISGSFGNLTNIEFAHNHINGINLAAAAANNPTIVDKDNGRAITAECAKFIKHGTAEEVTVYYFQLENIKGQQLTGKTSIDSKNATRYLGEDGFELAKISEWDGTNAAPYIPATTGISPKDVTIDPSNMADYLGADVEGTVVVLKEDAQHPGEGRATYSYNNGVGNSTFYLDWEANADLPTAINVIEVGGGLSIAGSYGGMTIAGADGTVIGVYDMSGRQVASETISGGKATITGLTPGIYVVNGQKVVVK